jgi:adenylate kinase
MGGELRKFIKTDSPEAIEAKSYMDQGLKVPTSAVIAMTENFIKNNPEKSLILDGVIRSKDQNDALAHLFGNFSVIYLELDQETAVQRLCGRRIDPVTQETFPASFVGETNPKTGNKLIVRADDTEDAIRSRISWSISDTLPLLDIWAASGHDIYRIDADQSEEEIFGEIEQVIQKKNSKIGTLNFVYDTDRIASIHSTVSVANDRERALFFAAKIRADLIYHTAALEGNPYTFPEIQTLLDGITV